jgi:hypothetical protein
MLLNDLYDIVKRGSETPLEFWADDLNRAKPKLVSSLSKIAENTEKDTTTHKDIMNLVTVLNQDSIDDADLAKNLTFIPHLFPKEDYPELADLIENFKNKLTQFQNTASLTSALTKERAKLKENLTPEEQKNHDVELYQTTGMFYCLEYYLELYKRMTEATTDEEKKIIIESEEIDAGIAKLSGLWIDFDKDEVYEKFIGLIQSDTERNKLTETYFAAKKTVLSVERICEDDICKYNYSEQSIPQITESIRQLIIKMVQSYQYMGFTHLGSEFLTPYGEKPDLNNLLTIINK